MWFLNWLSATDIGRKMNEILNNEYKNGDQFGDVREAATTIAGSAVNLALTVGFAVAAIALLIAAVKIGTGNPAERSEAKKKLMYSFIAAAGILLVLAIVLFIARLADKVITG